MQVEKATRSVAVEVFSLEDLKFFFEEWVIQLWKISVVAALWRLVRQSRSNQNFFFLRKLRFFRWLDRRMAESVFFVLRPRWSHKRDGHISHWVQQRRFWRPRWVRWRFRRYVLHQKIWNYSTDNISSSALMIAFSILIIYLLVVFIAALMLVQAVRKVCFVMSVWQFI